MYTIPPTIRNLYQELTSSNSSFSSRLKPPPQMDRIEMGDGGVVFMLPRTSKQQREQHGAYDGARRSIRA
ncbi:hypothetical protein IGI04_023792 [Brassica rapa subsp. trilocularis]|uniref:Uncharacterized protein n=1 Tax=Brassica rapa subsp. trilocularis TaxID=1813537 RepID=A0ABQ7M4V7_BRACM|nr:hypothetical protein IGI04_023792 [Brassica rapa subsp. trilocularis]